MTRTKRNGDRQRRRPQVEALESWTPLSGVSGAIGGAVASREVPPIIERVQGRAIALQGKVRGGYFASIGIPDVGTTNRFGAAGRLAPLGQKAETGRVQTTGFIASGRANGTLTISAPQGSLTLQLTGPVQPGFALLPGTLSYKITGGTRAFQNATGSGAITVTLNPSVVSSDFGLITLNFHR